MFYRSLRRKTSYIFCRCCSYQTDDDSQCLESSIKMRKYLLLRRSDAAAISHQHPRQTCSFLEMVIMMYHQKASKRTFRESNLDHAELQDQLRHKRYLRCWSFAVQRPNPRPRRFFSGSRTTVKKVQWLPFKKKTRKQ